MYWLSVILILSAQNVCPGRARSAAIVDGYSTWSPRRIRVLRVTNDSQQSILCDGTRGKTPVTDAGEPLVGRIVLHMGWIDQGNQDVDIKQERCHGNSSRS